MYCSLQSRQAGHINNRFKKQYTANVCFRQIEHVAFNRLLPGIVTKSNALSL